MQLLQNILYFAIWAGFIFLMMRYGCGALADHRRAAMQAACELMRLSRIRVPR